MVHPGFAPAEVFEEIKKYAVIPTFDLVIEYGSDGIIFVKRKIAPYKDKWALPGLRMYKGESIDDTIRRIAKDELGLKINTTNKVLLGQYVGKFRTENNRQDLSSAYYIQIPADQEININKEHFSDHKVSEDIPENLGAMYKYFMKKYHRHKSYM